MAWGEELLGLLRGDSSLSVPFLDLPSIAVRLKVPLETLKSRWGYREDLRKEAKAIAAGHVGRLRAEAHAGLSAEQRSREEEEEDRDLPAVLERYLEVYRLLDDRLGAVRRLQEEGLQIELDDVISAMQQYPAFDRAMRRQWLEGDIEVEDQLRRSARSGRTTAVRTYLQANMAEKYGPRVKVDVDVKHQLVEGDRSLVDGIRKGIEPPSRRPARQVSPDVVDGEFSVVL